MLEYLEQFNCVQTIAIFMYKHISCDSFKNIIYKLCVYK